MSTKTKRPDMKAYFQARINYHVHGAFSSSSNARMPHGVRRVRGDVTDRVITVEMDDGTEYEWAGGQYASRRVNMCYAPKMPTPVRTTADA